MSTAMTAARQRHPSSRWPAPIDALQQRVAQLLDLHGFRHADVAASLLEARGRLGCDVDEFARRLDVDVELLRRAEAGEVSPERLPGRLRRIAVRG